MCNAAAAHAGGSDAAASLELRRAAHTALTAVTEDLESLRFNRAIARIYELANALGQAMGKAEAPALREAAEFLVLMSAPMMPHLAEECWQALGHTQAVVDTPWPKAMSVAMLLLTPSLPRAVGASASPAGTAA